MARIHISEIQKILAERGEKDAIPSQEEGYFLEIQFDHPNRLVNVVDEDFKDKTVTVDSPYGMVTIQFDEFGQLKTIDLS